MGNSKDDKIVDLLLEKLQKEGRIDDKRKDPHQIREIVSPREFFTSEYYVGSFANQLYDFWLENLVEFFEGDYDEAIISGSKGSGKSSAGGMLPIMYKIYQLSCYKYPQRLFNFPDNEDLTFAYFSVKKKIAQRSGFAKLKGYIDDSPYFNEHFQRDKSIESELRFPNRVYMVAGSTKSEILGLNVLGSVLDEAGYYKKGGGLGGDIEKVRDIFADTIERRKNRFMVKGDDPGFSISISSATHSGAFIEQRKDEADNALHIRATKYEIKPENYSDDRFIVFLGGDEKEPKIVESEKDFKNIAREHDETFNTDRVDWSKEKEQIVEGLPKRLRELFITVVEDFRSEFESNIISSIQSIAGYPVGASGSFFSNREAYRRSINPEWEFPFTDKEPVLSTHSNITLTDMFKEEVLCERDGKLKLEDGEEIERYRPKSNQDSYRFIHIDLSSTNDPTGISMCHVEGLGTTNGIEMPKIKYDFTLRIVPPSPPARLDHEKVRQFVWYLKYACQFPIVQVTMDKHASETNLQLLNKYVLTDEDESADYLSTDSGDKMWLDFTDGMYLGNVNMYDYEVAEQELFELVWDREARKVDHPKQFSDGSTGHNDVMCSIVGAYHNALQFGEYDTEGKSMDGAIPALPEDNTGFKSPTTGMDKHDRQRGVNQAAFEEGMKDVDDVMFS